MSNLHPRGPYRGELQGLCDPASDRAPAASDLFVFVAFGCVLVGLVCWSDLINTAAEWALGFPVTRSP